MNAACIVRRAECGLDADHDLMAVILVRAGQRHCRAKSDLVIGDAVDRPGRPLNGRGLRRLDHRAHLARGRRCGFEVCKRPFCGPAIGFRRVHCAGAFKVALVEQIDESLAFVAAGGGGVDDIGDLLRYRLDAGPIHARAGGRGTYHMADTHRQRAKHVGLASALAPPEYGVAIKHVHPSKYTKRIFMVPPQRIPVLNSDRLCFGGLLGSPRRINASLPAA